MNNTAQEYEDFRERVGGKSQIPELKVFPLVTISVCKLRYLPKGVYNNNRKALDVIVLFTAYSVGPERPEKRLINAGLTAGSKVYPARIL